MHTRWQGARDGELPPKMLPLFNKNKVEGETESRSSTFNTGSREWRTQNQEPRAEGPP